MRPRLFWIGPRESDIRHTGELFSGSITLYGSGSGENRNFCSFVGRRINHNLVTDEQTEFIFNEQVRVLDKDPKTRFMSYNPMLVYASPDVSRIAEATKCLNGKDIVILPPSMQMIHRHGGRLLYYGADYIAYREIDGNTDR